MYKGTQAFGLVSATAIALAMVLGSAQHAQALSTKRPDEGLTQDVGLGARNVEAVRHAEARSQPPEASHHKTEEGNSTRERPSAGENGLSKVSAEKPEYKVSYSTTCTVDFGGKGNCWTFDESPCPQNQPLRIRTIRTMAGELVARDTYCDNEPPPQLPEGSPVDPSDIERAIREQRLIEVTPAQFQTFPILGSELVSQPNGFSLKNGYAHMFARSNTQTFEVDIFDEPVRIRATPQSYSWNYGDGQSRRTAKPGHSKPRHTFDEPTDTSHVYTETGDYRVSLTTAFSGEYSVNGGPWMPIQGTANVPSDPMPMSVWRTKKLLVDQTCAEDPDGPACDSPFLKDSNSK